MKNSGKIRTGRLRSLAFTFLVPTAVAGLAYGWQEVPEARDIEARPVVLEVGSKAPDFDLKTLAGDTWSLSEQAGKAVILEWIDPACPMVMRQHSPEGSLRLLQLSCEGRDDVSWIAINSSHASQPQSKDEATRAAKEKFLIDYPVGLDPTSWVGRAYGAEKATHVVLIDEAGKVAYMGAPDDGRERQLLSLALAHVTKGDAFDGAAVPARGCELHYAKGVQLGAALPPMAFKTMDGETLYPHQFLGAPLVIQWFNPHCPVVQAAHADGGALETAPSDWAEQGARWTFVNSAPIGHPTTGDENTKKLDEIGLKGSTVILDSNGKLMDAFGAKATPHLFVLDERGVLVYAGGHADKANPKARPLDDLLRAHMEGEMKVQRSSPAAFGCSIKRE